MLGCERFFLPILSDDHECVGCFGYRDAFDTGNLSAECAGGIDGCTAVMEAG